MCSGQPGQGKEEIHSATLDNRHTSSFQIGYSGPGLSPEASL